MHGICAKINRVANRLAIGLKCSKCKARHVYVEDQDEKLHDDVETEKDFQCLVDRINSGGGCEAAATSTT